MTITTVISETVNRVLALVGIALRLEYITPSDAQTQLEQNPALLAVYHLSQRMSGDASDETIDAAKGRPFVATLVQRIKDGRWKWYFGIIARLPNRAVIDGVTRLIAISKAGIPVWTLTYNDAAPTDFLEYDDPKSGRIAKDVFAAMGLPSEMSGVLAMMVPQAAGAVDDDGRYKPVQRDHWVSFFHANKQAFLDAFAFVKRAKGDPAVTRKALTAYMYFRYVARKGAQNKAKALHLLTVYKTGYAATPAERAMTLLERFFVGEHANLHARIHCLPLFRRVLDAALRDEVITYKLVKDRQKREDGRAIFHIEYPEARKARAARAKK